MDTARIHTRSLIFGATLLLVSLALCAVGSTQVSAAVQIRGVAPWSYEYKVSWAPKTRTLQGKAMIRIVNQSNVPIQSVWLRLRPNYPDELERISNLRGASISERRFGASMVKLRLRAPVSPFHRARIYFDLRLKVPDENTSLGRSAGVDLFGDALPVVAVAGPHGLRIGPEPSYGEGSINPVADWRVRVKVPHGLQAVLPGDQERVRKSRWSTTYATRVRVRDVAFAIGRFSKLSEEVGHKFVTVAGDASMKGELPGALRRSENAFSKMQSWYGGYRLPRLKVIIGNLPFGGSEYPGLVFSTPDNATISHEVAHQWFYGLVGNDQYSDPFLDESLTAFSEQRFHKSYRCDLASPIKDLAHGLGTGMSYWEKHPMSYEDTIYRGGACALTVLRNEIGSVPFDRALRDYVRANSDQIAGVNDFLTAVRAAAPGYDLARWQRLVGL